MCISLCFVTSHLFGTVAGEERYASTCRCNTCWGMVLKAQSLISAFWDWLKSWKSSWFASFSFLQVPAVPYKNPNNYVKYSGRLAEEIARVSHGLVYCDVIALEGFLLQSSHGSMCTCLYHLQTNPNGGIWGNQVHLFIATCGSATCLLI